MKIRVLILVSASLLLALLLGQLNHQLATWQVHVWCGGLFVAFSGLRMAYGPGATAAFLAGLLLDATMPVAFGTQGFLFLAAHAVVFTLRARAPRGEVAVGVVVSLVANLGLFLALGFLRIDAAAESTGAWMRSFADLLFSQVVLALIAPWFFAIQHKMLERTAITTRSFSSRSI
jgi:rod shape-determining protein MreD